MTCPETVRSAIYNLRLNNEDISTPANCRLAVDKISEIAVKECPKVIITYLAFPEAQPGEDVHYALLIDGTVFNTVPAPGFPVYIGPLETAPGLFQQMVHCQEVI